jgi:hypothetical protein
MMFKSLVALAILSVASTPVLAQTPPAADQATAKPQTVKKRVCELTEENSYSRLGARKVCHTVEVPVTQPGGQNGQNGQEGAAPTPQQGN